MFCCVCLFIMCAEREFRCSPGIEMDFMLFRCSFAVQLVFLFCVCARSAAAGWNERKPSKVKRRPVSSTQSCYSRITQCLCCVHTFEMHWAWAFDSIRVYYMRRVKNTFRIRTASALTITHRHTCTLFTGKLQPGAQAIAGGCRWCTPHGTPYSYIYISWTTHWCLCAKLELHLFAFCVFFFVFGFVFVQNE